MRFLQSKNHCSSLSANLENKFFTFTLFLEFNSDPFTSLPSYLSIYDIQIYVPLDLN